MREPVEPTGDRQGTERYEIRLKGHLDARWADRFEGMSFAYESDGTTLLSGPVVDQAALHGLLRGVRDLGLPLISVRQMHAEPENQPACNDETKENPTKKEGNP